MLRNLTELNINNNSFESFPTLINNIKQLPSLQSLTLNLERNEEVKYLLENIPALQKLNGQDVTKDDLEGLKESEESPSNEESVDNIQKSLDDQKKQSKEEIITNQVLSSSPKSVSKIENLDMKGKNIEKGKSLLEFNIIENICAKISSKYAKKLNKLERKKFEKEFKIIREQYEPLLTIMKEGLNKQNANTYFLKFLEIYKIISNKVIHFIHSEDALSSQILQEIFNELFKLFHEILDYGKKGQLMDSSNSNKEKKELNPFTKEEENNDTLIYKIKINELNQEKEDLIQKVSDLEKENKRILETLIKHSKIQSSPINKEEKSSKNIFKGNKGNVTPKLNKDQEYNEKERKSSNKKVINESKPEISNSTRYLTIKQLKELIQDMYAQKQKYDQKCVENKLPRETMEQYMYTYLNQRYGLKNLIIEWATCIINGIKQYSSEDNDVSLFGKILRNECDEDFRLIQAQLKNAILEVIKECLKKQYKMKTDTEIIKIRNDIVNGFIEKAIWNEIIKRMYNEEHYFILEKKVQDKIPSRPNSKIGNRKLTREELALVNQNVEEKINFQVFLKIVLDFQLKSHEKYLQKFVSLFKEID